MNELAADAIRAVTVGGEFLAELSLIIRRHVSLTHEVCFVVSERALKQRLVKRSNLDKSCGLENSGIKCRNTYLVSVFALAVQLPVLAHLCAELVDVGS